MKANKLFESLNDIDERIIEEAEMEEYTCKKRFPFMKVFIPLVAAVLLFVINPNLFNNGINQEKISEDIIPPIQDEQKPIIDKDLPKISIGPFNSEGAGFEGYMAYDILELINENPWNENANISSLPVFENKLKYSERGILTNPDIKAMRKRLDETIKLLNIKPEEVEIIDNYPTNEEIREITEKLKLTGDKVTNDFFTISQIYAKSEKYEITVYTDLSATINFKAKDKFLKNYYIDQTSPYEDVYKTAEYVKDEYKHLLRMKEPIINIYDGSYTFDGDQRFSIGFFDGKGNLEENIINYSFNNIDFYFDELDKTNTLIINKPDLSQKIGVYPIITPKEAEELLIDNKYITNVPEDFPGQKYIEKVELVYSGKYEENLIPYYLFYVDLENMKQENDLKTYGIYYVPAVEGKYIDNMDIMDARFN